jgi:hypothetical protein
MFQLILSGYSAASRRRCCPGQLIFSGFFSADLSLFQRRFRERDPTDLSEVAALLDSLSQLILSGFSSNSTALRFGRQVMPPDFILVFLRYRTICSSSASSSDAGVFQ